MLQPVYFREKSFLGKTAAVTFHRFERVGAVVSVYKVAVVLADQETEFDVFPGNFIDPGFCMAFFGLCIAGKCSCSKDQCEQVFSKHIGLKSGETVVIKLAKNRQTQQEPR